MIPLYYLESADGMWREWTHGNVDGRALKKRDPLAVSVNGVTVHALHFGPDDEWDCVNGKRAVAQRVAQTVSQPEPEPEPTPAPKLQDAQAYAMRVWKGQSDSLGRGERVARIKSALAGQGLSFDGVVLPT